MRQFRPLISTGTLQKNALSGQVAIITGAGGGIGFEAARSLAWLGCKVVIAEINKSGKLAAEKINQEMGKGSAVFIQTDVGDEKSIRRLSQDTVREFKKVNIVLNNATVATLGAVVDVPVAKWDASYRVNLRGPVLLAKAFLPGMVSQGNGVFVTVASEGLAYMGAYEACKAAQLHLARTIDAELQSTGVIAFTVGPGLVPTDTALQGLEELARFYGQTIEEMEALTKEHLVSVEAAGAGFAAAIALASQFRGQEIGVKQALFAVDISIPAETTMAGRKTLAEEDISVALALCQKVLLTLEEQSAGWQQRSVFERQWMLRDFKKYAGMPVEQWLEKLKRLEQFIKEGKVDAALVLDIPVARLAGYYNHLQALAKGYVKDPEQLEENLRIIESWEADVRQLSEILQ